MRTPKIWVILPYYSNLKELEEAFLPMEGEPIIFIDTSGSEYTGYFIWSGEYTFLVDKDGEEPEYDVIAWRYTNES